MKAGLRNEMIKRICVRDGDKILDVACGDGTFLHELTQWRDAQAYGIESDEDVLAKAKEQYPELHVSSGENDFLDFEDNTFRIITVCDDFHKFHDPEQFISEATRVLTPGGRLYIGERAYLEGVRIALNLPKMVHRQSNQKFHSTYEILDMFKSAGLTKFRVHKKKQLLLVSAKKPEDVSEDTNEEES